MVGLCRYKERSSMEMEHDKTFCFTCAIFHVFAHCIVTENQHISIAYRKLAFLVSLFLQKYILAICKFYQEIQV